MAKESAYFLLAFVNIGLVPDGGSSLFVPTRVGFARAIEMAMLGERIHAPQALEWGLINRVVADDDFQTEVDALVDRLAAGPTRSYAGTKRQLNALALRPHGRPARARGRHPAGDGRVGRLPRGRDGLRPEARRRVPRRLSGPPSGRRPGPTHTITRALARKPLLLTLVAAAVLALLAFAGPASAGLLDPEHGGSPNADRIDTSTGSSS